MYQILSTTEIFPISWGGTRQRGTGQRVLRYYTFQRTLLTKWDCGLDWIPFVWTTPRSGKWRGYIFTSSWWAGVFQNLSIRSVLLITPGYNRHANDSKTLANLAETRVRQNPPYKGGGTEKDPNQWGGMNGNTQTSE